MLGFICFFENKIVKYLTIISFIRRKPPQIFIGFKSLFKLPSKLQTNLNFQATLKVCNHFVYGCISNVKPKTF